jgi:flagellar protein FlaG
MSLEIGPTPPLRSPSGTPATTATLASAPPSFEATLQSATQAIRMPVDTVELAIPAAPPEEVRDAIGVAADQVDALAASGRELHFHTDEASGRVIVEVRDLATGKVIRTIPPSHALDVLSGVGLAR